MTSLDHNAAAIREAMGVVSREGLLIGEVTRADAGSFRMISTRAGCAFERVVPLAWVSDVTDYVFLQHSSDYVASNARTEVKIDPAIGRAA